MYVAIICILLEVDFGENVGNMLIRSTLFGIPYGVTLFITRQEQTES
jgi:hypothetical protein